MNGPRNEMGYRTARRGAGWVVLGPEGAVVSRGHPSANSASGAMTGFVHRARKLAAPGAKTRPCLGCGAAFASEGIHNRLCDPCRRAG